MAIESKQTFLVRIPSLQDSSEVFSFEVGSGLPILKELALQGVFLKSTCGGFASCRDCIVKVTSGEDNCLSPSFEEIKLLGNVFHLTKERLACQLKICGPITIEPQKKMVFKTPGTAASDVEVLKQKKPITIPKKIIRKSSESILATNLENSEEGKIAPTQEELALQMKNRDWKVGGKSRPKRRRR